MKKIWFFLFVFSTVTVSCKTAEQSISSSRQAVGSNYWQQHVDYKMEIDVDPHSYSYKGKQTLVYTNNSPDTLNRVLPFVF